MTTKHLTLTAIFAFALTLPAIAQTFEESFPAAPDPLMGDWSGRWTEGEDVDPELHAEVVPLGGNKYRITLKAKLNLGAPPKAVVEVESVDGSVDFEQDNIRGQIRGDAFTGERVRGEGKFSLKKAERLSPTLGAKAPEGAIVLFDGSNMDAWDAFKEWEITSDGFMMVKPKGTQLQSKQTFTSVKMHIEFRTPYMPAARGQQRGNSGVFVQDVYEVQILDSYGLPGYYDECGALYKVAPPMVNAVAPPLQWQTYDIEYTAPEWDGDKLVANPRITVHHNGTLIHNDREMPWITAWTEEERLADPPKTPGRIKLQGHGNYVQFRNIWVVDTSK